MQIFAMHIQRFFTHIPVSIPPRERSKKASVSISVHASLVCSSSFPRRSLTSGSMWLAAPPLSLLSWAPPSLAPANPILANHFVANPFGQSGVCRGGVPGGLVPTGGWGASKVGPRRVGPGWGAKMWFSFSRYHFRSFCLSGGRRDPQMCAFGVLRPSCEVLAAPGAGREGGRGREGRRGGGGGGSLPLNTGSTDVRLQFTPPMQSTRCLSVSGCHKHNFEILCSLNDLFDDADFLVNENSTIFPLLLQ